MTPLERAQIVGILAAAYPGARLTEATLVLYEAMLADLDEKLARDAVGRLIATSKFLPTIAEIREAAINLTLGQPRAGLEAWNDVLMAIRRTGYVGVPTFEDPLVAECVRLMGWRNLCLGETPEGVDRARFCELYAELQRKQRQQEVSEPGRLLPAAARTPAQLTQAVSGLAQDLSRPPAARATRSEQTARRPS